MNRLLTHDWPGNVRELENTIERAVIMARGGIIAEDHITFPGQEARRTVDVTQAIADGTTLDVFLRDMESRFLREALRQAGGQPDGRRRPDRGRARGFAPPPEAFRDRRKQLSSPHFSDRDYCRHGLVEDGMRHAGVVRRRLAHYCRPVPTREEKAAAGSQVMRGMVLVIDDDAGVRAVMATALEDDGWVVTTAENGRRALEALQRSRPEAIILDLRMPVMDGLTFAQRYREYPEPRAPLILISATVTHEAIKETGAVTGLRKPIDLDVLLDTVREHADAGGPDLTPERFEGMEIRSRLIRSASRRAKWPNYAATAVREPGRRWCRWFCPTMPPSAAATASSIAIAVPQAPGATFSVRPRPRPPRDPRHNRLDLLGGLLNGRRGILDGRRLLALVNASVAAGDAAAPATSIMVPAKKPRAPVIAVVASQSSNSRIAAPVRKPLKTPLCSGLGRRRGGDPPANEESEKERDPPQMPAVVPQPRTCRSRRRGPRAQARCRSLSGTKTAKAVTTPAKIAPQRTRSRSGTAAMSTSTDGGEANRPVTASPPRGFAMIQCSPSILLECVRVGVALHAIVVRPRGTADRAGFAMTK